MAAVSLFTRTPGSTIQHAINEATEQPSVSELVGTQAARVLWGDAVATSVAIGGGAAMATLSLAQGVGVTTINVGTAANPAINLGGAASLVTVNGSQVIQGDLTVNGTTTALNTVNVTITDAILLIAAQSVPAPQVPSAWTIERGTSGDDALVYWNTTNDRFELGLFDTVGGTVAPAGALAVTTDLRLEDLIVAGTSITGEAALDVTATAADLTLAATGANTVVTQTNGLDRWFAASDGGQEYVGLAADPSVSAAGDARLIYNSVSNTLRVSFNGVPYVDVATSTTVSLQGAYNNGATIATSTAQGVIGFSGSAANNDNVLSVAKTPAGAQTGSALAVSSNANASSTTFTVTRSAAAGLSALFSGGSISCPDTGASSERFGDSSTATGIGGSAFGTSSTASGLSSAAFGSSTSATATSSCAFGSSTTATAGQATALGVAANAAAAGATVVGQVASVLAGATVDSIAIGHAASVTAAGGGVAIGNQPISFTNVVCIGLGSGVGGLGSTVVGDNAVTGAAGGTALGASAAANVVDGIAIGNTAQILAGATASSIVVGSSFAAAGGGVAIGTFGAVAFTGVVGVGLGSTISAAGTVMVGSGGANAGTNAVAVGRGISIGAVSGAVAIGNAPSIAAGATAGSIVVSGSGTGGFSATGGGVICGGGAGATTFTNTVIVGLLSSVTGVGATVVGAAAIAGPSAFAGGTGAMASASGVAVGASASDAFGSSIVLGASAVNTATNQFIAGSTATPMTLMVVGAGVTSATPSALVTWRTTDATAASAAAGSSLTIRAGNGDGAGANGVLTLASGNGGTGGGTIAIQTAGTTQWSVTAAGDLLTSALNDIGDLANTARPANVYVGTSVVVGTTVTINSNSVVGSTVLSVTATTLDLNLSATAGSVVVTGAEAVADAIQLTASNAAGGLDLNAGTGGITLDAVGAGAAISLDAVGASNFTVSGATADLTLGARAATITLNEAGNTTLVSFTATSIIGALNELKSTPSGTTFTAAVALSLGQATYISATNSVDKATGTADNALARVIGLAQAAIGAAATGKIVTEGAATGLFVAGLTLAAGDEIFLSLTAGSLTNDVSAFVAGNVVQSIGYLKDPLTYNGIGDLLAQVLLVRGPRLVL